MDEVKLHIASLEGFFAEAREAASRLDAGLPVDIPATISFESTELLLETLTANRWHLLRMLGRIGPVSIRRLAGDLGRDYRAVHRDVTELLRVGLIERHAGKISVPWRRITVEMAIDEAA